MLQQYMNWELPDVQAAEEVRRSIQKRSSVLMRQKNQRSNSQHHRIIEKTREFQKNIYYCFTDYAKAFDSVDHKACGKLLKR